MLRSTSVLVIPLPMTASRLGLAGRCVQGRVVDVEANGCYLSAPQLHHGWLASNSLSADWLRLWRGTSKPLAVGVLQLRSVRWVAIFWYVINSLFGWYVVLVCHWLVCGWLVCVVCVKPV